jgi:hypothetical protein
MNTKEPLSRRLERLSAELRGRPSLVEPVLERIANKQITTTPRSARFSQRKWRYMFSLAAGLFLVALVTWWTATGSSMAFADVQAAIRKITTVAGKAHYPNAPHRDRIGYMSADHKAVRAELPGGLVVVMALDGKRLMLNTCDRVAYIGSGQTPVEEDRVRHILLELAELDGKAVRVLDERVVNGRRLQGFVVPMSPLNDKYAKLIETRVWVDPTTRLPVVVEHVPIDPNNVVAKVMHSVTTYDLNVPLDDTLFSLNPPAGYRLVKEGALFPMPPPVLPKGIDLDSLIVRPKEGIGKARFGMSVDQIYGVLGMPDKTTFSYEHSSEIDQIQEQLSKQEGDKSHLHKRLQDLRDSRLHVGWWLSYQSLGFELTVSREGGFGGLTCYGKMERITSMMGQFVTLSHGKIFWGEAPGPFVGRTEEGITVDSTPEDVIEAYGEPTEISHAEEPDSKAQWLTYIDENDGRVFFCFVNKIFNNVMIIAPQHDE